MEQLNCPRCNHNEYNVSQSNIHLKATCKKCGAFIKFIPQNNVLERFPFGQYKDQLISDCQNKDYLKWLLNQEKIKIGNSFKNAILKQLSRF